MFCTNCGSKIPEGSKFCSECGARVAQAEPTVEPAAVNLSWNEPEEKEEPTVARRHTIAFDWSNVKEESHRKPTPEVHSPWGTTGLNEKELFAESADAQDDHSRTMSFIDILKKEREVKAQEAEEEARPVTDKEETEADYTAFQEAPSFYVPPLYDDIDAPVTTPYDEQKHAAEISLEQPAEKPEFSFDDEMAEEEPEEEEHNFDISDYEFDTADVAEDEVAEKYHTTSFNEPDIKATEDLSDLEASLAAILDAGAGRAVNEEKIDLFEEKPVEQPSEFVADSVNEDVAEDVAPEDIYLSMDEVVEHEAPVAEPVVEPVAPVYEAPAADMDIETAVAEEPIYEEPEFKLEDLDIFEKEPVVDQAMDAPATEPIENIYIPETEEIFESSLDVEPIAEEPVVETPVEEPVAEAVVEEAPAEEPESVEDEIEALKKRLAELMGTSVEAEEEPEEIAKTDELSLEELIAAPVGAAIATEAVETIAEEPAVEEPAVEVPAEEPVVEEPVVEVPAVEPVVETPVEEPVAEAPVIEEVAAPEVPSEDIFDVELKDEEPEEVEEAIAVEEILAEVKEEAEVEAEPVVEAAVAEEVTEVEEAPVEPASDAISLDELERDLFGETTAEEIEQEETKKIDKFYTLYKKNEEFQKLLDEEYSKLQGEEKVPHVNDFVAEKSLDPEVVAPAPQPVVTEQPVVKQMPVAETPVVKQPEPVAAPVATVAPQEVVESKPSRAEIKAAKKAAKLAAMEDDDDEEGGSKVLTILAIIIAVVLVILLGVIIILNFFPDSAIGIKIDSIVSTTTSYFSAVGGTGRFLS